MNFAPVLPQSPGEPVIDDVVVAAASPRIYCSRLLSYARLALDVIEEHDLPFPGNDSFLSVLAAALDARFTFAEASVYPRSDSELDSLLRHLLLFALRPACELEVM